MVESTSDIHIYASNIISTFDDRMHFYSLDLILLFFISRYQFFNAVFLSFVAEIVFDLPYSISFKMNRTPHLIFTSRKLHQFNNVVNFYTLPCSFYPGFFGYMYCLALFCVVCIIIVIFSSYIYNTSAELFSGSGLDVWLSIIYIFNIYYTQQHTGLHCFTAMPHYKDAWRWGLDSHDKIEVTKEHCLELHKESAKESPGGKSGAFFYARKRSVVPYP